MLDVSLVLRLVFVALVSLISVLIIGEKAGEAQQCNPSVQ